MEFHGCFLLAKIMSEKKKPITISKERKEFVFAFAELANDVFMDKKRSAKVKANKSKD